MHFINLKTYYNKNKSSLIVTEKALKWTKKVEKKGFDQLLGGHSTQKLVKIHNRWWQLLLKNDDVTKDSDVGIIFF